MKSHIDIVRSSHGSVRRNSRSTLLACMAGAAIALSATAADPRWVLGFTEPILDVTLSAPVAGIVGSRPLKEGDKAPKGKVVLELDNRLEELEVQRRADMVTPLESEVARLTSLNKTTGTITKSDLEKKESELKI